MCVCAGTCGRGDDEHKGSVGELRGKLLMGESANDKETNYPRKSFQGHNMNSREPLVTVRLMPAPGTADILLMTHTSVLLVMFTLLAGEAAV